MKNFQRWEICVVVGCLKKLQVRFFVHCYRIYGGILSKSLFYHWKLKSHLNKLIKCFMFPKGAVGKGRPLHCPRALKGTQQKFIKQWEKCNIHSPSSGKNRNYPTSIWCCWVSKNAKKLMHGLWQVDSSTPDPVSHWVLWR